MTVEGFRLTLLVPAAKPAEELHWERSKVPLRNWLLSSLPSMKRCVCLMVP